MSWAVVAHEQVGNLMHVRVAQKRAHIPQVGFCREKNCLQAEFLKAIHELNRIQDEQTRAVIDGDPDFCRFDILLHMAQENKEQRKYAWMAHVEAHGCHDGG